MTALRIIADDLTGALDTAAPLVALAGAIPVFWDQEAAAQAGGTFALDTESRDAPRRASGEPWWRHFEGADLAYKKLDSLLRGRTALEIAECLASGRFASAVIAPAFPAQQRITRAGRQYWRRIADDPWQAVECDLAGDLRRHAVPLTLAAGAGQLTGRGFYLCDAVSEADLAAIGDAGRRLAPPVLWCGSAGLARALAGRAGTTERGAPTVTAGLDPAVQQTWMPGSSPGMTTEGTTQAPPPPLLMLIGSHHPVTLAQVEGLRRHGARAAIDLVIDLDPTHQPRIAPALAQVAEALDARGCAALVVALPDGTGREVAAPAYRRTFEHALRDLPPPRALFVTGGATLHQLVQALGARALLVTGELAPGIPCSTLEGGAWPGAQVVSKSGAFGDPGLLIRLAESAMA